MCSKNLLVLMLSLRFHLLCVDWGMDHESACFFDVEEQLVRLSDLGDQREARIGLHLPQNVSLIFLPSHASNRIWSKISGSSSASTGCQTLPSWCLDMKAKLQQAPEKALYALRKQTVEPVFGIIKSAMGFIRSHICGLANIATEWTLVVLAYNYRRITRLRAA